MLAGLKALQAHQKPGQCFTLAEIARALHVDERTIAYVERKALAKATLLLQEMDPRGFNDVLRNRPITEVIAQQCTRRNPARHENSDPVSKKESARLRAQAYRDRVNKNPEKRAAVLAKQRERWHEAQQAA